MNNQKLIISIFSLALLGFTCCQHAKAAGSHDHSSSTETADTTDTEGHLSVDFLTGTWIVKEDAEVMDHSSHDHGDHAHGTTAALVADGAEDSSVKAHAGHDHPAVAAANKVPTTLKLTFCPKDGVLYGKATNKSFPADVPRKTKVSDLELDQESHTFKVSLVESFGDELNYTMSLVHSNPDSDKELWVSFGDDTSSYLITKRSSKVKKSCRRLRRQQLAQAGDTVNN